MRVFLAGGTGYVGIELLRRLVQRGHDVVVLVRPGSERKVPSETASRIALATGDALSPESYRESLRGCDAVIYLPGLLREIPSRGMTFERVHFLGVQLLANEAAAAGAGRFLLMSALGVARDARTPYERTKFAAEEHLRRTPLRWTIFRPSILFGNEEEGIENFFLVLRRLLSIAPFAVPVPGSGAYRFQPVSVKDVARGFAAALENEKSVGRTYDVAGPREFTYDELVRFMLRVAGRRKALVHIPMGLMKGAAKLLGRFGWFPVTHDQLVMLEQGSTTDDWRAFFAEFGFPPTPMTEAFGGDRGATP